METASLCIQQNPETFKRILGFPEKRYASAEKYVEQKFEEDCEEGLVYSKEELFKR